MACVLGVTMMRCVVPAVRVEELLGVLRPPVPLDACCKVARADMVPTATAFVCNVAVVAVPGGVAESSGVEGVEGAPGVGGLDGVRPAA